MSPKTYVFPYKLDALCLGFLRTLGKVVLATGSLMHATGTCLVTVIGEPQSRFGSARTYKR